MTGIPCHNFHIGLVFLIFLFSPSPLSQNQQMMDLANYKTPFSNWDLVASVLASKGSSYSLSGWPVVSLSSLLAHYKLLSLQGKLSLCVMYRMEPTIKKPGMSLLAINSIH